MVVYKRKNLGESQFSFLPWRSVLEFLAFFVLFTIFFTSSLLLDFEKSCALNEQIFVSI